MEHFNFGEGVPIQENNGGIPQRAQLQYPLDKQSIEVIRRALESEIITRLFPVKTDDPNEGTEEIVDFNPTWKIDDAATKTSTFFFIMPSDLRIKGMELIWVSPASSGNMRLQIDISAGGKNDEPGKRTTGGTPFLTATVGGDLFNYTELDGKGNVDLSLINSDDIVGIRFTRTAADAADTLNDGVNIYGMKITLIGIA